jgi:exonuclease III
MYGWNLIDQVLVRPDVVPYFKSVNILESAGGVPLASPSGHPNRTDASDHFPLVVTFES